jgi:hypothetical protein
VNIEIHNAALAARIQKQLQATGSGSVEEVLLRLLENQKEGDRWLLEGRKVVNTRIKRGIDQLDRGEGIPEDQLDAHLARLKIGSRAAASVTRHPKGFLSYSSKPVLLDQR